MSLQPWVVMWTLAFAIYCACKWFTWSRVTQPTRVHGSIYLLFWPGLDAETFLQDIPENKDFPTSSDWHFAIDKTLIGLGIFYWLARKIHADPYWVGWAGMVGIVMTLHFGLFHLLSCWWRACGIVAKPIMDYPLTATSLSSFWGRRWNTAFPDLTQPYLFKPLAKKFGVRTGLFAGFLFSGLVHDLVISVPAGGGYGGPTLFFMIQPFGMMIQRRFRWLGRGFLGWLMTAMFLILPAGLLFHRPFVVGVIVPFMHAIGAL
jgi:hypothetical protein